MKLGLGRDHQGMHGMGLKQRKREEEGFLQSEVGMLPAPRPLGSQSEKSIRKSVGREREGPEKGEGVERS